MAWDGRILRARHTKHAIAEWTKLLNHNMLDVVGLGRLVQVVGKQSLCD